MKMWYAKPPYYSSHNQKWLFFLHSNFYKTKNDFTINNTEAQKPMNSANDGYEFLANSQNHNNTVKESNNKYTQINDLYIKLVNLRANKHTVN